MTVPESHVMGERSTYPSQVVLPETEKSAVTLLDFLEKRFPGISRSIWEGRMKVGNVLDGHKRPIYEDEPYTPGKRIFYFRESEQEISVPFFEQIIHSDDHILVVEKPHFLPVIPSGPYVNQCLLNRLKKTTGNENLTPIHRIDRETAGLVVFSVNPRTRGLYQQLFMEGQVLKTYEAVTFCTSTPPGQPVAVENRIVQGEPFFRMKTEPGIPNARSWIRYIKHNNGLAVFHIEPATGKKHQIRLHLSGLGFGIVNDRYYPDLLPEQPPDFEKPLQLLAKRLSFPDPVTGRVLDFRCTMELIKLADQHNPVLHM